MRTIEGPIHDNLLTYKEHNFNEGSSVRKRNYVYGSYSRHATVTASSTHPNYRPEAAIDGIVDGYPGHPENEWASTQKAGAKLRLTWDKPITLSRLWLFGRPYQYERVAACRITLSDRTTFEPGELPNVEGDGLEVTFPPRQTEWVEIEILATDPGKNCGLAEVAAFVE